MSPILPRETAVKVRARPILECTTTIVNHRGNLVNQPTSIEERIYELARLRYCLVCIGRTLEVKAQRDAIAYAIRANRREGQSILATLG